MANIPELLSGHVTLEVECLDRLHLNGYIGKLAAAGGFVTFHTEQLRRPIPSPVVLGQVTEKFREAMRSKAERDEMPIDRVFRKWLKRVPLPLRAQDREAGYDSTLSTCQVEVSLTQIFGRPLRGREFFEETVRDNLDLGRPDVPPWRCSRPTARFCPFRSVTPWIVSTHNSTCSFTLPFRLQKQVITRHIQKDPAYIRQLVTSFAWWRRLLQCS